MQLLKGSRAKLYNFLRWSEKYTHTDMVYLARGAGWLNLGTVLNNVIVFLLAIAFANLLPKEIYGTYRYIISLAPFLLIANLPGIKTATTIATARGYEGIVKEGYKTRIKWGGLSSLASFVLGLWYLSQGNPLLGKSFFVAAAFLPFVQSADHYLNFLTGKKKFRENTRYNFLTTLFYALFMIGAMLLTDNIFALIIAYFGGYTIINNSLFALVIKKFKPNRQIDSQNISYGKHLTLMEIIYTAATHLDRILVFHYAGAIEMAIYSFAVAIPQNIKGFFSFIVILAYPKWSRAGSEEIKISIKRKIFQLLAASAVLITVYYFSAPLIYKIFFPQYTASIFLSRIYIFSFLNVVPTFILPALETKAKVKELYLFKIIDPLSQITLMVILGANFGVLGIVFARVFGKIMSSVISLFFYKKI